VATVYFDRLYQSLEGNVFSNVRFRARNPPADLYHYTSEAGFRGILGSNRLWATSAAEAPRNDKKEIAYGCQLFDDLIQKRVTFGKLSDLSRSILQELKELPWRRIDKIFLVSLCEKANRSNMYNEFGTFCLRFAASREGGIGVSAPQALAKGRGFITEMLPAIYDLGEQEATLDRLLDLLIATLENRALITGSEFGPWTADLARSIAVTVADFALKFIVPLKKPCFRHECEWRIVVRPNNLQFSSDPAEADRNCECYIKIGPAKRYVELCTKEPDTQINWGQAIYGLLTPSLQLPISDVQIASRGDIVSSARWFLDRVGMGHVPVVQPRASFLRRILMWN
jgi:hypothetical protein